ncbi:YiiX/YebB-like N1pC/P60 family cysteine hydrolase [Yoonia sp.]|uniref:YiiX/YebB-like N1pC/P60 family cysteine hydrolase n=1 Tax=Yoonia sp. TaxID=2212373 RepID=UPI00358FC9EC
MTYDNDTRYPGGPTPFSGSGDGTGNHPPEQGSYIRLAPSGGAVQDIGADQLMAGDLILSTTTDMDSAAIRSVTESPVSHVALYMGDGMVIEAIGQGVVIHPLSTALSDDYYAAAYRKLDLNDANRASMVRWLRTQEGRPYDVGGLLSDYTNDPDAWFCSELVFAAFAHVGKPLSAVPPHDSEPGHVLTMTGVDYLGHLKRPGVAAGQGVRPFGSGGRNEPGRFAPSEADRDAMITPGYHGMTFDASQLEVGDMVVTSASSAVSEAIRQRTGRPASHVALYVGDGMVVEAVQGGVEHNTLSVTLGRTDFAAAYRMPGLTAAEKRSIKAYAMDAVARGVGFDYLAIGSLQHWQDDDALFCSELVFEAYGAAGRSLGNAQQSSPGQVITLRGVEYLGHLPANRDGHAGSQSLGMRHARAMSGGAQDAAVQAAVAAGASPAEAQSYFGVAMSRSLSGDAVTLPDVTFLSDSNPLMAGISTLVTSILPGRGGLDALFDFCTQNNICLAIGLHGGMPIAQMPIFHAGVSGGLVIAPNRRAGVYLSGKIGFGYMLEVATGVEIVIVAGGESNFAGIGAVVGGSVDGSEGFGVGFRVLMNSNLQPIGVIGEINFTLGVPGASSVELTASLTGTVAALGTVPALSLSASGGESPQLAAAIRIAMQEGATEEEARAFFTASSMSHPLSAMRAGRFARPLGGNEIPPYAPLTGWRRAAVEILIDQSIGRFIPGGSRQLQALARERGISIGIGAGLTIGLGGSGGGGIGIVFLPNGDMAMYGSFSIGGGWNFELSASYDLTIIRGDASAFFGESLVVGGSMSIDAGASVGGGMRAVLPPGGGDPIGVILQGTVGLGLPIISTIEGGLQETTTTPLSAAPTIIGGLPVYPAGRAMQAPPVGNVIPFSHRARSRAMSAAEDIDVKLRVFIPSPALPAPPNYYFSGDNRGFQYSGGTSRAEIHAKVRLINAASGTAQITSAHRSWGATKQYDAGSVRHVAGKPDWWYDTIGDPRVLDRGRLDDNDSNLNITARSHSMEGSEAGASYGKFRLYVDGGIPLMTSLAPNINAQLDLELRRGASGVLMAQVTGNHDGFPAYELYVNGQRIHHYDPVTHNETPNALFGVWNGERSVNVPWRDVQGSMAATQALSERRVSGRSSIWM